MTLESIAAIDAMIEAENKAVENEKICFKCKKKFYTKGFDHKDIIGMIMNLCSKKCLKSIRETEKRIFPLKYLKK